MHYTNRFFQYAANALHAKHYISNETKLNVRNFFEQIRQDFISNIQSSYWLNQTVLDTIIHNITDFTPIIGYRDEILNDTNLIENYKHFWPIENLGDQKIHITAQYFDPEYRKTHPLLGIQFFELAILIEDKNYLGQFRKLLEPNLLNFQVFFENFRVKSALEGQSTKYICKNISKTILQNGR
jgi:hypothetical protein